MTFVSWYLSRMHGSCKGQIEQYVTTINEAMGVRGICEGAKQFQQSTECRCSVLLVMQRMLILSERLSTVQMYERWWEKSYESCWTPVWKKGIVVWCFQRTSQLVIVWAAKRPSKCFVLLSKQFILLTKYGSGSAVTVLLEDELLIRLIYHLLYLRPHRRQSIHISQTTARW